MDIKKLVLYYVGTDVDTNNGESFGHITSVENRNNNYNIGSS